MGGSYYTRPVQTTSSSTGASAASAQAMSQSGIHADLRTDGKDRMVETDSKSPIIVCFDVTGSMGEWPRVIYDKMPMLYGQIMANAYMEDPSICFMAVGADNAILQCSDFATGMEIDEELKKVWIAGSGNGAIEYYEFVPWFLNNKAAFTGGKPFFFLIGDAGFNTTTNQSRFRKAFPNDEFKGDINVNAEWKTLCDKAHVFYMHKYFWSPNDDARSMALWTAALGAQRIMRLDNAKACADAILGVIAIASGQRTLETYMDDMVDRGQDDDRCKMIREALTLCEDAIQDAKIAYAEEEDPEDLA